MMYSVSKYISNILHPFVMPVYFLIILFNTPSVFALIPWESQLFSYIIVILSLIIVPMACLPILKKYGLIQTYSMQHSQERIYPIMVEILSGFIGFLFLKLVPYSSIVQQFYLIMVIELSIISVISINWKISMHLCIIGNLCAFIFVLGYRFSANIQLLLAFFILCAGLLATSRLYLGKHNIWQISAGFLLGISGMLLFLH